MKNDSIVFNSQDLKIGEIVDSKFLDVRKTLTAGSLSPPQRINSSKLSHGVDGN
jgi:hypothetical protein